MKLRSSLGLTSAMAVLALGGWATGRTGNVVPAASFVGSSDQVAENYQIGPSDELSVFVWRNPELSTRIAGRPAGPTTPPLVPATAAATRARGLGSGARESSARTAVGQARRVTTPLLPDMVAVAKTPAKLADDIR